MHVNILKIFSLSFLFSPETGSHEAQTSLKLGCAAKDDLDLFDLPWSLQCRIYVVLEIKLCNLNLLIKGACIFFNSCAYFSPMVIVRLSVHRFFFPFFLPPSLYPSLSPFCLPSFLTFFSSSHYFICLLVLEAGSQNSSWFETHAPPVSASHMLGLQ